MRNKMYTFLLIAFVVACNFASYYATTYWREAEVVAFEDDELAVLEDEYGHIWTVRTDELVLHQKVKMTVRTNLTDNTIKDDYISKIKVIGYTIKIN